MRTTRILLAATLAALTACTGDSPTASAPTRDAPQLTELTCTATPATGAVSCAPTGGGRRVIYGTQGKDVRVNSFNVHYDPITQLYTFDVTVTNLRPEAIGTKDGTTLDPKGVRVYFGSGPTVTSGLGVVLILNPDGTDLFLLGLRPYYQWNQVLQPGETSIARGWVFLVPLTVQSFTFNLYVSTEVGPTP
jgi:hypothetical protein